VVAPSWPNSVIPWGAALRINAAGEVEFENSPGKWIVATGATGAVTLAKISFMKKDKLKPDVRAVTDQVRNVFIDPVSKALRATTWEKNDFGRWGWNLRQGGNSTAYFIHTTPEDEHATAAGTAFNLANSHGCVHLKPSERDKLMNAGFLKEGVAFEVRPYTESGPPP
jgi:lipoprotein-anchoring transpeptidase ErfK/SrfK